MGVHAGSVHTQAAVQGSRMYATKKRSLHNSEPHVQDQKESATDTMTCQISARILSKALQKLFPTKHAGTPLGAKLALDTPRNHEADTLPLHGVRTYCSSMSMDCPTPGGVLTQRRHQDFPLAFSEPNLQVRTLRSKDCSLLRLGNACSQDVEEDQAKADTGLSSSPERQGGEGS